MNEQEELKQYGQLVAKAWGDPAFKERLLTDPAGTLRAEGFNVPADMQVRVLEPSGPHIYVPLPAQMPVSEQPETLVQLWSRAQADPEFRARFLTEPDAVLAEQGLSTPAGVPVEVVETSDTQGYIAVPPMPEGLDADSPDDVAGYFCAPHGPLQMGAGQPRTGVIVGAAWIPKRWVANDPVAVYIHRPFMLGL